MSDFIDFIYDGLQLSDFGYTICSYDGEKNDKSGSEITWNTTPIGNGSVFLLASTQYTGTLSCEFDICKDPCQSNEDFIMTESLLRSMTRWLNRHMFLKFQFVGEDVYYEGSFNVTQRTVGDDCIGLHLVFQSNRPYGIEEKQLTGIITSSSDEFQIKDDSDDIGVYTPLEMTVKLNESGDLTILNTMDENPTVIKNCESGETLKFYNYNLTTDSSTHTTINDDFNYNFPKITNTYEDNYNIFVFSLACTVTAKWYAPRKVGL